MEQEITPVYLPHEVQEAEKMIAEIRFDCIVKAYDMATRSSKNRPPQWFALKQHMSLEFIETATEQQIGYLIKKSLADLKSHIAKYENGL